MSSLKSRVAHLSLALAFLLLSSGAHSMIYIDEYGRIVHVSPLVGFLEFRLEPAVFHVSRLAIELDESYISDSLRRAARERIERLDAIAEQPFRYEPPSQIVSTWDGSSEQVFYFPNGTSEIDVSVPPFPNAVK